jgi:hypothetical protein
MAIPAGTTESYDMSNSIREDLEDTIWDLFPADTWALTNLDKVKAESTTHEWLLDSLEAATINTQLDGDDASFATVNQPLRFKNSCQISRKNFLISGTVEAVTLAGRRSEVARQAMKQMRELKRDIEKALVGNQAMCVGSQTVARISAGMESFIASTDHGGNAMKATTTNAGSTVGFSSGTVTAPTDGASFGGLSQTTFNNALLEAWQDGGDPRVILVGPAYKDDIDGFTSQATRTIDVGARDGNLPVLTSVGVYVSDFGTHTLVLHRYVRNSNPATILMIDPDYWATAWLRRPFMEPLAKTGDGEKRQILAEFCLVARNPNSSSKVFGLT